MTEDAPSKDTKAETQSSNPKEELTPVSEQGPESMEVEEGQEATPSVEQELSSESKRDSDSSVAEPLSKDPLKLPASPAFGDKMEHLPVVDQQERSPCPDPEFPSLLSSSVETQEALSAVDMDGRLLPHSEEEEEEEEEYDEQMKEGHNDDIKQELQDSEVKPDLLLDETSNMSHGDESSSGFLGSPGEPDPQLSMELGLVPAGRSHADNLLTETDDSLPFEPLRTDREKTKRRGSPGRSRVKQVRSSSTRSTFILLSWCHCHAVTI